MEYQTSPSPSSPLVPTIKMKKPSSSESNWFTVQIGLAAFPNIGFRVIHSTGCDSMDCHLHATSGEYM